MTGSTVYNNSSSIYVLFTILEVFNDVRLGVRSNGRPVGIYNNSLMAFGYTSWTFTA